MNRIRIQNKHLFSFGILLLLLAIIINIYFFSYPKSSKYYYNVLIGIYILVAIILYYSIFNKNSSFAKVLSYISTPFNSIVLAVVSSLILGIIISPHINRMIKFKKDKKDAYEKLIYLLEKDPEIMVKEAVIITLTNIGNSSIKNRLLKEAINNPLLKPRIKNFILGEKKKNSSYNDTSEISNKHEMIYQLNELNKKKDLSKRINEYYYKKCLLLEFDRAISLIRMVRKELMSDNLTKYERKIVQSSGALNIIEKTINNFTVEGTKQDPMYDFSETINEVSNYFSLINKSFDSPPENEQSISLEKYKFSLEDYEKIYNKSEALYLKLLGTKPITIYNTEKEDEIEKYIKIIDTLPRMSKHNEFIEIYSAIISNTTIPDPVRIQAIIEVGNSGTMDQLTTLIKCLNDINPYVRSEAAIAIGTVLTGKNNFRAIPIQKDSEKDKLIYYNKLISRDK